MPRLALPSPLLTLAALGLFLSACAGTITGAAAQKAVADGALLLDVRSVGEFAEGHLEGAVNIPVGDLEGRLAELEPKDRAIVLYCRSGLRTRRALSLLRERGWTRVENLGPMSAWNAK